ncbi:cytochrome b [Phormidium tenue FACHB-886]|nr:cytochrome b [Phormidium tenue FACHB-886]
MTSHPTAQGKAKSSRLNSAFKHLWSMHWVMATCYLLLFTLGTLMVRLPEELPIRESSYTLHKSVGALTMALLTWRIFVLQQVWWRKYTRRLPKFTAAWIRTAVLHTALYLFMLAAPISGFFLSNSYGSGNVPFFWVATLPDLFPENAAVVELARDMHFWITYTFLAFIVLHLIAQQKFIRSFWKRLVTAAKR